MLTEKEISLMTSEEISDTIKLLRTYQMKSGNVILKFFKNSEEPEYKYTLKQLYQWYKDFYKGSKVPVEEVTFNLKVMNMIDNNEISLKNLIITLKKEEIDKKEYKRDLGIQTTKDVL
jgi:hypothetical protein